MKDTKPGTTVKITHRSMPLTWGQIIRLALGWKLVSYIELNLPWQDHIDIEDQTAECSFEIVRGDHSLAGGFTPLPHEELLPKG